MPLRGGRCCSEYSALWMITLYCQGCKTDAVGSCCCLWSSLVICVVQLCSFALLLDVSSLIPGTVASSTGVTNTAKGRGYIILQEKCDKDRDRSREHGHDKNSKRRRDRERWSCSSQNRCVLVTRCYKCSRSDRNSVYLMYITLESVSHVYILLIKYTVHSLPTHFPLFTLILWDV